MFDYFGVPDVRQAPTVPQLGLYYIDIYIYIYIYMCVYVSVNLSVHSKVSVENFIRLMKLGVSTNGVTAKFMFFDRGTSCRPGANNR